MKDEDVVIGRTYRRLEVAVPWLAEIREISDRGVILYYIDDDNLGRYPLSLGTFKEIYEPLHVTPKDEFIDTDY